MDNSGKKGGLFGIFIILLISLIIASLWNSASFIKNSAHSILDPTAGVLLNWNLTWGMVLIIFVISVIMTLFQKYATDQKTLKELKEEQKKLNKQMREFKDNPEKIMELNKKILPLSMQMMSLSMRPIVYTAIPLILFFRWFMDFFASIGDFRFFGFFSWFWFYLIATIIFSSILRKIFKVV